MTRNMSTEITELPDKGRRRQMSDQKRQVPKIKNLLRKQISSHLNSAQER